MKNIFYLIDICLLVLILGCSKQEVYDIPTVDGEFLIYDISSSTTTGISTLDSDFTVNVTFATAKPGDEMNVELLKSQLPSGGTAKQWRPIAGTQKTVTVGNDMRSSITYTRSEAQMNSVGDAIKVVFSGETDYNVTDVTMVSATTVSNPQYAGKAVVVTTIPDTAFFNVTVKPLSGPYTGNIIAKRKNGKNEPWVDVGDITFTTPALVPISGNDFTVSDTMYYSFTATSGPYVDIITKEVVRLHTPYFFLKKTGTLILGDSKAGVNVLTNTAVAATSANAIIAIDGNSLVFHGGLAWAVAGKSIHFVPSTLAMYNNNRSDDAIAAYEAGTPLATADPIGGEGVYIFKIINGPKDSDILYGMIKAVTVTPGISVAYEYRIGNLYAHLAVIK